jgi:hypothetical protein
LRSVNFTGRKAFFDAPRFYCFIQKGHIELVSEAFGKSFSIGSAFSKATASSLGGADFECAVHHRISTCGRSLRG